MAEECRVHRGGDIAPLRPGQPQLGAVEEGGGAGRRFDRKSFGLSFGLKNGSRFHFDSVTCLNYDFFLTFPRDGEVPQMTTSPQSTSLRIWEDLALDTGPQYRSLLYLSHKNRTYSPLQVLNFRGLVRTASTVLPVLPSPDFSLLFQAKIKMGFKLKLKPKNVLLN